MISQLKNEQKLPKMQSMIYKKLHKNVNENMFSLFHSHFYTNFPEFLWMAIETTNMLQLYTANFLYPWFLIILKLRSTPVCLDCIN